MDIILGLIVILGIPIAFFVWLNSHQNKAIENAILPAKNLINGALETSAASRILTGKYKDKEVKCELFLSSTGKAGLSGGSYIIAIRLAATPAKGILDNYPELSKLVYIKNDWLYWKETHGYEAVKRFSIVKHLRKFNESRFPEILEKLYDIAKQIDKGTT